MYMYMYRYRHIYTHAILLVCLFMFIRLTQQLQNDMTQHTILAAQVCLLSVLESLYHQLPKVQI